MTPDDYRRYLRRARDWADARGISWQDDADYTAMCAQDGFDPYEDTKTTEARPSGQNTGSC